MSKYPGLRWVEAKSSAVMFFWEKTPESISGFSDMSLILVLDSALPTTELTIEDNGNPSTFSIFDYFDITDSDFD